MKDLGRKILVFQHAAWEPLGTLTPLLKSHGLNIRYINFQRHPDTPLPDLSRYSGLIILGGPMHANETTKFPHLKTELKAIETFLKNQKPILGICLGSQLLAKTLGATIHKNKDSEIGWVEVAPTLSAQSDYLLKHLIKPTPIFQWHLDSIELSKDCKLLAQSQNCNTQAFSYQNNTYGLQFHLEVDQKMIERWLKTPENLNNLKLLKINEPEKTILKETGQFLTQSVNLSQSIFEEFAKLVSPNEKKIKLSSGHR